MIAILAIEEDKFDFYMTELRSKPGEGKALQVYEGKMKLFHLPLLTPLNMTFHSP